MQDLFSVKAKGGSEYYMFIFVIYFVIPVVIISVCYTRVFYILYSDISSVEVQNEVRYPYQYTTSTFFLSLPVCLAPSFSEFNRVYVNKHTWVVGLRPTVQQ